MGVLIFGCSPLKRLLEWIAPQNLIQVFRRLNRNLRGGVNSYQLSVEIVEGNQFARLIG